MNQHEWHCIA